MKKILTLFLFLSLFSWVKAQLEISAFNATGGGYATTYLTDYQCLGVNPANLGWTWNDHKMNLGLSEFALSLYSEPLSRKQVMKDMFDEGIQLSLAEKQDAAEKFTDAAIWAQAGATLLGFSYQDDVLGGIAFSVRTRGSWYTKLNSAGARFLFLGYNDPYFDSLAIGPGGDTTGYSTNPGWANNIYNGTKGQFLWYMEYNLGYGRKIISISDIDIYGGIGLKYIVGYSGAQYLQTTSKLEAFSALSPVFEVEYSEPTPSRIEGKGLKKTGTGMGIDLGATVVFNKNLKASLALLDIGSIKWDGNVYQGNNTSVWSIETGGIDNYNIFAQGQLISSDNLPDDPNLWEGLAEKKVNLPTNLRAGVSYKFMSNLEAGADILMPVQKDVPGAYQGSVIALGGRYQPVKWVQLSLGMVTAQEFGVNIPLGVTFFPVNNETSSWQIGFAVRDAMTWLKQDKPTLSAAFGFLRFSFGEKE